MHQLPKPCATKGAAECCRRAPEETGQQNTRAAVEMCGEIQHSFPSPPPSQQPARRGGCDIRPNKPHLSQLIGPQTDKTRHTTHCGSQRKHTPERGESSKEMRGGGHHSRNAQSGHTTHNTQAFAVIVSLCLLHTTPHNTHQHAHKQSACPAHRPIQGGGSQHWH